jgi:hypothetical protein
MEVKAMRLDLAVIAGVAALAAAAGCAARAGGQLAGAPSGPAATGAGVAAPQPAPPAKSVAKQSAPLEIAAARDATPPPPSTKWKETHPGLEGADTRDCLGCHGEEMVSHAHPVEIDYAEATQRVARGFRPIDEVRARGLVLRGSKVGCPTCHSAASPWARFLAVPRDLARARPGMAELLADNPERVEAKALAPPPDGAEVSSRPLCESCHATD